MSSPFVSICIPAYKADRYIGDALASIKAQKFADWEVIVTEDGTKDRTEEIVRSFAATVQQRVVYNRHEQNRGLPHTRNTGIGASSGRWVAFLDADDAWEPDHLMFLAERAAANDCDMVFSGSKETDAEGRPNGVLRVPTPSQLEALPEALFMGWLSVMPSSVMIRRDGFERFGPVSTEYRRVNDTEYWLRLLRKGGNAGYSGHATCLYRTHPQSATHSAPVGQFAETARLCEENADWDAIPAGAKRSRPASLYRWAANIAMNRDPKQALQLIKRSLRLQPLNPKSLLSFGRAMLRCLIQPRSPA